MPPMLGDMVVAMLGGTGAVEIVGQSTDNRDLLDDARAQGAELVVVRSDGAEPVATLTRAADLDILAISADARTAALFSVAQRPMTLDRESLATLALSRKGQA